MCSFHAAPKQPATQHFLGHAVVAAMSLFFILAVLRSYEHKAIDLDLLFWKRNPTSSLAGRTRWAAPLGLPQQDLSEPSLPFLRGRNRTSSTRVIGRARMAWHA